MFYYKGKIVTEAHFIFVDPLTSASASVRLRALRKQKYTDWDVLLYGIPQMTDGKEVVICWFTPNIDYGTIFYTDSNGLEM